MATKHKELQRMAERINELKKLLCELHVNRRNGYYAVDKYIHDGKFVGPAFIGTFKETHHYLQGMLSAIWWIKPF